MTFNNKLKDNSEFKTLLEKQNAGLLYFDKLQTLQVNLGNICNQRCSHCHVSASPEGINLISSDNIDKVIAFIRRHPYLTLDLTGGAPEMHPLFKYFIEKASSIVNEIYVRSNLTVLTLPDYAWTAKFMADHNITVMASLPCYTAENVDKQRGPGVFNRCIEALHRLNALGYGSNHKINLIYNPGGAFLPGSQKSLETDYRRILKEEHEVIFNNLLTITNVPIGRFADSIDNVNDRENYLCVLKDKFNPAAAENIMCRKLINVGFNGTLFNCDFNQALNLPVIKADNTAAKISDLDELVSNKLEISMGVHCFACTAGEGSSCTGQLL
ncbi:MAG: arsenosugar biosynthesis radical SAM (seleno)protein ArsS [Planctomycetota bacterium]|jgi:radical SAM/Cys-rich protein